MYLHNLSRFSFLSKLFIVLVKENKVDELAEHLQDVAANWYIFTGQLGVSSARRNRIKEENPNNCTLCLLHGLREWVRSDEMPTYQKISKVLRGRSVTDVSLAEEVETYANSINKGVYICSNYYKPVISL